ncbi:MAG TPA: CBS domain-containing protein [Archangium sp.]|uniref:CBS domain-containing protein n=1 Tax=Archangium sp. TaxID=1872627 RepID=UPI002E304107|nr:CBS domain-containing protein [Archangium sp.]HEX5746284.1 CBS domain-containing protein [Archangium sp.]
MAQDQTDPPGSGPDGTESSHERPEPGEHDSAPRPAQLRVRDVMSRNVSTLRVSEELTVEELLKKFRHVQHLPVVGANNRLMGMLTRMDVLEEALHSGRERWIRVRNLMSCPVQSISEDEELPAAARAMRGAHLHSLAVVDASGSMVGILTDGDLLSAMAGEHVPAPSGPWELPVDALMTPEPLALGPDARLDEAAWTLIYAGVRHLPVVDEGDRLLGIISERDLRQRLGGTAREWPRAAHEVLEERVGEMMTPEPLFLRSGASLGRALELFTDERVGALPVVDEDRRLLGILSYIDLLRWLRERLDATWARGREGGEPLAPH